MYFPKPGIPRSLVAAVLTAALMLAAPGPISSAGESSSLEKTRSKIAEIRKRLAESKGKAAAIQSEVNALDKQVAELNRQIASGEHDISELESNIRTAGSQIDELEAKYRKASEASNQRARRLYKAGPAETLGRLFSSKSVVEVIRLQVWFEISSEIDGKTIIDASRLKSELNERRDDLKSIKSNLNAQRKYVEARRNLAAGAKADRNAALQQVKSQIAADEKHIEQLEADSKRLTSSLRTSPAVSRASPGPIPPASRGGFVRPVPGRTTSPYGGRRGGFHSGVDIDGNTGEPIRAAKAGTVAGVTCGGGYGICTIIDHGGGVSTLYAHQSRKAIGSGSVSQGQVIGYIGCTGSCTGSHLHFEVRINGAPRNPAGYI